MHRERSGDGQLIEIAQLETGANLTAELVIEWSAHQRALPRDGNRDERAAPQGVYPCRAELPIPEWVAITVADDQQWHAFATALGRTDWLGDEAMAAVDGRFARHDELDTAIAEWTRDRSPDEIVEQLRPLGIPTAHVLNVPRMYTDPQLLARAFYQELAHAKTGIRRYPGWPMRFSFLDDHHRFGAPTLGQHNREVLTSALGLTESDVDRLEADGVIGDRMGA
jgi:crotonobetainyl-CoA:carnitine CoA-transferase CaiB-like acyl-CoA transferase